MTLTREDRADLGAPQDHEGWRYVGRAIPRGGVISEADQELRSFRLRDLVHVEDPRFAGVDEMTFGFDEHVYEIVMEAFISLERVVVVGEMIAGKHQALDIKFESAPQPERTNDERQLRYTAGHRAAAADAEAGADFSRDAKEAYLVDLYRQHKIGTTSSARRSAWTASIPMRCSSATA